MTQSEYDRRLEAQLDDAAKTFRRNNGERPGGGLSSAYILAAAQAIEDAQYATSKATT